MLIDENQWGLWVKENGETWGGDGGLSRGEKEQKPSLGLFARYEISQFYGEARHSFASSAQ